MFNVTVINAKKSLIRISVFISIMVIVFWATKLINTFKKSEILQINISHELVKCLNYEIPAIETAYYKSNNVIKEDGEDDEEETFVGKILSIELAKVQEIRQDEEDLTEENQVIENNIQNTPEEYDEISLEVSTGVLTEIVTQNSIAESYNIEINGVKIKNETSFEINNSILDTTLNINKENILIFHTHTCESYTPSEQFPYQQTGNFRTTDLNYSVARVGSELCNYLLGFGFNVTHDKTYHDYPAYSGSYTRSSTTVENVLKTNSSDIIIDLHRDAIGSKSNYDPSVKIGEDVAAQLMFVIGTNGGGLYHPNWQSNLKFAIELQQKANEMYPGLFKPMIVRNSRYNQHLGSAACIIEVGATGNTLEQCLNSMKYLAKVIDEL
ncbi:MAG: stage II sporulation protein P [Clostridia bacterium]|nr:stage II sporulation protein P [Clostridia bacterium]